MKSIFYVLAVVAIGASGFFGWTAKEKFTEKLSQRDGLVEQNKRLSDTISERTKKLADSEASLNVALDERAAKKAEYEAAVSNTGDKERTLDQVVASLEVQEGKKKEIDDALDALRKQFPGVELVEVPRIVKNLEDKEKKLIAEQEELELILKKREESVAKNLAETTRVNRKVRESIARVEGNTFQATITQVDNNWNFVVIGAGAKSGLSGDSKLLVHRRGRLLAKLALSNVGANSAVADIVPGSLRTGVLLQPGDQVILESVRAN